MNTESAIATTDEATDPNVIVLETPIQRGEQVIRSVRLRKPTAGDLRGIKLHDLAQMDVTALVTLLPRITQPLLTQHDAAKLEPADLLEVAHVMSTFFVPKASKESLPA
ncbi:phage tail assembly protein [Stenotrophomonas geniculata]|uniref:phage tail assembly protein n=1 Tax=Stenotrophomonas geniculata TaxID=86188 RepID=UPI001F1F85E7|nr:phage tail assembly protein [Stenotrophomonas maltophilia]